MRGEHQMHVRSMSWKRATSEPLPQLSLPVIGQAKRVEMFRVIFRVYTFVHSFQLRLSDMKGRLKQEW